MKKKIIIGVLTTFTIILLMFTIYYFISIGAVNKNDTKNIDFTIKPGQSKVEIAKELEKKDLIKDDKVAIIYMFFNNDLTLQAGTYSLNKSMNLSSILAKFSKGDIKVESEKITLLPGKRLLNYVEVLSENFKFSKDEMLDVMNDKEFLQKMIDKYWFLTSDILNDKIYYGLEGYIMPDTYEFMSDSSVESVITKLLDETSKKLEPYKDDITKSGYNIHEILTMASIVELEANTETDRKTVAQVIYKRLKVNMSLGMDVTTYYAEQKEMGSVLTVDELNKGNGYNTRNTNYLGLPVGPISNPSLMSIEAVFNPSKTDYLYFYADIKTGKVYFANTIDEFYKIIREVG